jgi:prephenate dehydrogenase
MARRKKTPDARPAAKTAAAPSFETLLARKASTDPHAWEAMLNLNKMRAARRKQERDAPPAPATKDRD